ncbi:SDR family oxidoreductase [Roseospira visakhapatnamensis]|uniref:Citronellol/citronellal dehydrogenase n=1 Tax=Roseospira visakhapatnamensis TaxID=390880 RepID=A0A7W6RCK3_9PROT|nr:NAD(P)-dependent oxidoreductase [Roseospira visakhapatnamensis]MBB4265666.1 citronellol/citronellal dehydrogenase [Roseospira visakhapatnamensis]
MVDLRDKTLFITGASRGIGQAIATRAARDGANIIVAAKTAQPHAKLPGTIHDSAAAVEAAGGRALPVAVDVRDEMSVARAVAEGAEHFGGIDIVVNNASAISLTGTAETPMKRVDLMWDVNMRGTFAVTQACLPWLRRADNPHILTLSPPPSLDPAWYGPHVAYTLSKMGMSLCVLGWAEEFRAQGIAANALWPRTVIDTAALAMLGGAVKPEHCRTPAILADAAHAILTRPARTCTGRFFIDDEVLREAGVTDLSGYAVDSSKPLLPDLFLPEALAMPRSTA